METSKSRLGGLRSALVAVAFAVAAALGMSLPQAAYAADDGAWDRLWGQDGYGTMSAIVDEGWEGTSDTVVLATFNGYWDALTAAGVAGMADAPVLMTDGTQLSDPTAAELKRLAPKTVIVCGGTAAVSDNVAKAAGAAAGGAKVERLWGAMATDTANDIFAKAEGLTGGTWDTTALLATSQGYWDALSAAPISFAKHQPIFLTSTASTISSETLKAMQDGGIKDVYIVGGEVAITPDVEKALKEAGFNVAGRFAGATAVETSALTAEYGLSLGMDVDNLGIATVNGYWDALSGAPFCGKNNSVIVLVKDADSASISGFVKDHADKIVQGWVFGGSAAVADDVEAAIEKAAPGAQPADEPKADDPKSDEPKAEDPKTEPEQPADENTITITYVTNVDGKTIDPVTIEKGAAIGSANLPFLQNSDGAVAVWYDNAEFSGKAVGKKTTFDQDATLYAKFGDYLKVTVVKTDGTEVSKTYTQSAFEALVNSSANPQSSTWNYQDDDNGSFKQVSISTATKYVTFEDLITDVAAGDATVTAVWNDANTQITCAAADGFSFTRSAGDLKAGQLYKWDGTDTAGSGTAVTPCLGLEWKSGSLVSGGSLQKVIDDNIAAADSAEAPRAIYGITEAEFKDHAKIPAGRTQVSYIADVRIVAPQDITISYDTAGNGDIASVVIKQYDAIGSANLPFLQNTDGAVAVWYDNAEFSGKAVGKKTVFTEDATLYAKFGDYLTVNVVKADGTTVSKAYSKSEFAALANESAAPQSSTWNYQDNGGEFKQVSISTATKYVTFEDLITDVAAGDDSVKAVWQNDASQVECAAADGFSFTRSAGDLKAGQLYKWDGTDTAGSGTAVTPCLGLKWKTGTLESGGSLQSVVDGNIAAADEAEAPRAIYGITAAEFSTPSKIPVGRTQVSYIATVTITAPEA